MNKNLISNLSNIMFRKHSKRYRQSSYDRTGENEDFFLIKAKETKTIFLDQNPGVITHIWMTMRSTGEEQAYYRKVLFSCYWDQEEYPSVLTPIGDFFGMGHGITKDFTSEPLQMSPDQGRGFNSWWPMPYEKEGRIDVINECDSDLILYFYIDYEKMDVLPTDTLRFHAQFKRECPTVGKSPADFESRFDWLYKGKNLTGKDNYIILDATGAGHYCGCHINIHNLNNESSHDWIGEGDDMIFIDGEDFPPRIHGTGTEDYINTAYCPKTEFNAPYHGIILAEKENWKGRTTYYRYHIQDPIMFNQSIKVTIEHGHNNHRSDDWSTTAYWYQTEPHKPFCIPNLEDRMPIDNVARKFDPIIKKLK